MALTNRLLTFGLLAALASAIGACSANNSVQECGDVGVFCPAGYHCAAAQGICIKDSETCGNAKMDPGEICDDGNQIDTDKCNRECSSTNECGNNKKDTNVGEECDDNNRNNGDGCSSTCKMEFCGNFITDSEGPDAEACDDGNHVDGDGCSADCKSNESCGNGKTDTSVGEACDPPMAGSCSDNCQSTLDCNNGVVDPGEDCDIKGMVGDNRDCRADCITNVCGDGRVNTEGSPGHTEHVEQCDDATRTPDGSRVAAPVDTQTCDSDCSLPSCGDGRINRAFTPAGGTLPEECDDIAADKSSLNADSRDCTALCQVNRCGDGHTNTVGPDHIEQCDDGDRNDSNACTNECKNAKCGDGILRATVEQCDDSNELSGDGCTALCVKEFCGDGVTNNLTANTHEDCDGAGVTATCNANCTTAVCGDGIVNPLFTKPGAPGPEQCDPPSAANGCSTDCQFEHCGNGITDPGEQCDDGNATPNDNCFACHFEVCGNGILDAGEQCDDGNAVATDSCVSDNTDRTKCKLAVCGDGVTRAGLEQCDNGSANGQPGNACSSTCHLVTCGNGFLEQGEECDDGNASDHDDCVSNDPAASSCKIAKCGDGHLNTAGGLATPREQCDDGDLDGGDGCSALCRVEECGNAIVDPGEECDNGVGVNSNAGDCRLDCILNRCGDGHVNLNGENPEQCDGGPLAASKSPIAIPTETATCNINCTTAVCGDGIINHLFTAPTGTQTEQCDDGAAVGGDGCSSVCQFEVCGNGFQDVTEQCDLGGANANTGACTVGCKTAVCGDGFTQTGVEDCDKAVDRTVCDYATAPTTCEVCNSVCQHEDADAPSCGDGNTDDGFEACDDSNTTCGSCNNDCTVVVSAKATGLIFAGSGIADGDTLKVDDGVGTSVTFTFRTTPPGTNEIRIESITQTASNIANAIESSGVLIDATAFGAGFVSLTHARATSLGNGGSGPNQRIKFTGATGNFAVIDMRDGAGGDCADDEACVSDDDCASGSCVSGTCETPDPGILAGR